MPQVTLKGSTCSIEEWNGSKGPNLEEEDDDDDITTLSCQWFLPSKLYRGGLFCKERV
jgi:hypothetical protein